MDLPILFSPSEHSSLIPSLVTIHKDCITIDGTMATFMPPLSDSKMTAWWQQQADQVAAEKRLIVVQFCAFEQTGEKELAGVVMLDMPASETGPFRGTVEKLLVSPRHRRKGIARQLMARLEEEAKKVGRTVLVRGHYCCMHFVFFCCSCSIREGCCEVIAKMRGL